MPDAGDSLDLVVVESAADGPSAQLLAGRLRAEGIPAEVRGGFLVDAWAMSQKGLGLMGVEVWVPRSRLGEAQRVLASLSPVPTVTVPVEPTATPGPASPPEPASRQGLIAELGVVILLAFLPVWYGTLFWASWPYQQGFVQYLLGSTVADVGDVALVLLLMSRSGESWASFGLTRPRWLADPAWGIVVFVLSFPLVVSLPLPDPGPSWSPPGPLGKLQYLLFLAQLLFNVFMQELVARGYLIARLERLLGSRWKSIALSALLFSSWHFYQGLSGVLETFLMGLIYGAAFCGLRRLWPLVIAHALWNLLASS